MTADLQTKLAAIKDECRHTIALADDGRLIAHQFRTFAPAAARALLVAIEQIEKRAYTTEALGIPAVIQQHILEQIAAAWEDAKP